MTTITPKNQAYPPQLQEINKPPSILYAQGNINLLQQKCIAVVGPRKASFYGKKVTEQIVSALVHEKYCIVSGLAEGVDSIAHATALHHNGNTIAIVGNGLDIIYPKRNHQLYRQIAEKGLILSEYPPGTPPLKHHFPLRNRIVSGLSQAVIIIEATLKSGSLITAEYAFNQNREVFAIPGNIFRPTSAGTHQLITQNKAKLVTSAAEIIDHLTNTTSQLTIPFGSTPRNKTSLTHNFSQLSDEEKNVIDIIEASPLTAIDLAESLDICLNRITSILTNLELREFVRKIPGARYQAL